MELGKRDRHQESHSSHLTLCCPWASFEARTVFAIAHACHIESAHVWHQSRDLTSCALDYIVEHARSCLACGERVEQKVKFSFFFTPKRALLWGFTKRTSRSHCTVYPQRAVKTLCVAGFSLLTLHVLVQLEQEIKKLTRFSSLSLALVDAPSIVSS